MRYDNRTDLTAPGPWSVSGQSEAGRYITVSDANGKAVARVRFNSEHDVNKGRPLTDHNDASLIAAAPAMRDLLFALFDGDKKIDSAAARDLLEKYKLVRSIV